MLFNTPQISNIETASSCIFRIMHSILLLLLRHINLLLLLLLLLSLLLLSLLLLRVVVAVDVASSHLQ